MQRCRCTHSDRIGSDRIGSDRIGSLTVERRVHRVDDVAREPLLDLRPARVPTGPVDRCPNVTHSSGRSRDAAACKEQRKRLRSETGMMQRPN